MATADVPTRGSAAASARVGAPAKRSGVQAWAARIPTPLKLLLAVGAVLSIAWNLATPAFPGPDAGPPYAYLQYLAETGHLPSAQTPSPARATVHESHSTEEQEALR